MIFNKGDKVEVMNNREMPISWRVAEFVSCSSHTCQVCYCSYPCTIKPQCMETVPFNFVRPCPPLTRCLENFTAGDIVEVFHVNLWKVAVILNLTEEEDSSAQNKIYMYLVRLLGSSCDLTVGKLNIRKRQAWHDDKWILLGKTSQAGNSATAIKPSFSNGCRKIYIRGPQLNGTVKYSSKNHHKDIPDAAAVFGESPMASSRSLKRTSPHCSTTVEEHDQKLRAVMKEGQKQPAYEKVVILGQKKVSASGSITISKGYKQTKRTNLKTSELNNSDSIASSVGSCSITKHFRFTTRHETDDIDNDDDALCSDAESSCGPSHERETSLFSFPPHEEGFKVSIRRFELVAYRSTLEALYASGPLSWDKEELLTNLRVMLHISNDEHLQEDWSWSFGFNDDEISKVFSNFGRFNRLFSNR